jgi:signal-transduction protein with cAMP-binding, CBS, and nucleotidyltransferase domain
MSIKITFKDLSQYQPLDSLNPENIKEIASKLQILEFKKGDILFKQGDTDSDHLYLHKGTVEFFEGKNPIKKLEAGTEETRTPLGHVIPRNMSAIALSDVILLKVNGDLLDMMLTWDQTGNFKVEDLNGPSENEDWMSRILQTEAFHRIPPSNPVAAWLRAKCQSRTRI